MDERGPLWHCPRHELAQSYLAFLGSGVVTSTSIFGPRRTGKTIFLLNDLQPAAEAAGYRIAYADLWQTDVQPGLAIVRGLEEALKPRNAGERAVASLRIPVSRLKLGGGVGAMKGEAEIEFGADKVDPVEVGILIDDLMAKLVARKPLLLLLDEAQTLAKNTAYENLARSLRTALTKHRSRVRVVYTGSNRARLAHMFSDAEAPLYSPGMSLVEFPVLGLDLCEFAAKKFAEATGGTRTLYAPACLRVLERLQHRPQPFLEAVLRVLATPGMTIEDAAAAAERTSATSEDYAGTWASLNALQRELLKLSLSEPFQPFAAGTTKLPAANLGLEKLAVTNVQRAMSTLDDRNILAKSPRGQYEFDDHLFKRWIKERLDSTESASAGKGGRKAPRKPSPPTGDTKQHS